MEKCVKEQFKEELSNLTAIVAAGICANPFFDKHITTRNESVIVDYAMDIAMSIIRKANERVNAEFAKEDLHRQKEEALEKIHKDGEDTGFLDKNGRHICNGDIFVYVKYENIKEIPEDLVTNYEEKYSEKISLHPVFWSEDHHTWASDVYGDEDLFFHYKQEDIIIVTNNQEHPELYNH